MADGHGNWFERLLGAAGLALGAAVVVFAVSGWTIPAGGGSLGSDLFFSSGPTGELEVVPSGPFLRARGLKPGSAAATGSIVLRNQTGALLGLRLQALPDRPDLDGLLQVRILDGRKTVFRGTLGDLAAETDELVVLGPGDRVRLRFQAWLPAGLEHGYEGRIVSVPIQPHGEPL